MQYLNQASFLALIICRKLPDTLYELFSVPVQLTE
jgi:hypothetical protein